MKYTQKQSIFYYVFVVAYSTIGPQFIEVDNDYQSEIPSLHPAFIVVYFYFSVIIETLVFSTLPFVLLLKISFLKKQPIHVVILTSILFGAVHGINGDLAFAIVTIFPGFIFNLNYLQYLKKHDNLVASISTASLHFLVNLTTYTLDLLSL